MEKETLQQTTERLLNFSGKVRGEVLINHARYVKKKEGKGGLEKLERRMEELGAAINFRKIKAAGWYSEGLSCLAVVVSKELLYWKEEDVFQMGEHGPQFSLGIKLLVQSVVSPERLFKASPAYWNNLFNFGSLEPVEFSEELQWAIIRIKDYKTHPLLCVYHAGYIKAIAEFVLKNKKVTVEETACVYKGKPYDEYRIKWK